MATSRPPTCAYQLDDRALFLARGAHCLLELLDAQALRDQRDRAEFRRLVESWDATASVDSVGYRLVRAYHDRASRRWGHCCSARCACPRTRTPRAGTVRGPLWERSRLSPCTCSPAPYPTAEFPARAGGYRDC